MSTSNKFLKSSAILVSIKFIQRSLGLISTLVLARLLTPEDFGIVAVAMLVIYFSEVLSNTGMQQYLVQVETIDKAVINTSWTLNLALKSGICLMLYFSLPLVNNFYQSPLVIDAVAVLIPVIFIRALKCPQLHIQRRELEYGVIFRIGVISKAVSFIVVVAIAMYSRSFWAIIVGDIVASVVGVILSYYYCRYFPKLSIDNIKTQWQFSRWMMARGFLGYTRTQIDTFLVSQFFSLNQLGNFSIARELTVMPANEVITPAVEPLLATFSKVRNDKDKLQAQFLLALVVIFSFVSPIAGFIFFYHEEITFYILGEKWASAAPLMQAMTPLLITFSLSGVLNSTCIAVGKLKQIFYYDLLTLSFLVLTLYFSRTFSIETFVWIRSGVAFLAILIFLTICSKFVQIRISAVFLNLIVPLSAGLLTALAIFTVFDINSLFSLLVTGVLFVLVYSVFIYLIVNILSPHGEVWNSFQLYLRKSVDAIKSRVYSSARYRD